MFPQEEICQKETIIITEEVLHYGFFIDKGKSGKYEKETLIIDPSAISHKVKMDDNMTNIEY